MMKIGHYVPQKRGGPYIVAKTICENIEGCEMFENLNDAKKYDLIHLHHQINPKLFKRKFIETFHGLLPLKYCTNLKAKLSMIRWHFLHFKSIRKADYVIAVSKEANRQIKYKANKIIHMGIEVDKYKDLKKEKRIIFLNSLEKYENLLVLLKAFNNMDKKYPLDVYGEGRLESYYKSIAQQEVKFHNEVDNEIIKKELSTCKCLVQCTLQETFGVPIIEAMASGTIAIISDIPSHRENFQNVLFVKPNDYKKLGVLIEEVMNGKHDHLIEKARKEVKKKYPLDKMIKQIKEVYKELGWNQNTIKTKK